MKKKKRSGRRKLEKEKQKELEVKNGRKEPGKSIVE